MDAVPTFGKTLGRSYQGIPLTDAHEISFTGNPFSFSGRKHHPLWKKIPVEYLKQWPDSELKKKSLRQVLSNR